MERIDAGTRFIAKNEYVAVYEETRRRHYPDFYNKHEGYELVAVKSGACQFCVENRKYSLRQGDVAFAAEGEHHCINVSGECVFIYINFRPELLFSHPALRELFLGPFLNGMNGGSHKVPGRGRLTARLLSLMKAVKEDPANHVGITEKILGLMKSFQGLKGPGQAPLLHHRLKVKKAADMIYRGFAGPLSADQMARECGLSRVSFYRHFCKAYGQSPGEFINALRLDRAAFLLISTGKKVADAAESAGFRNLSNFNRLFLKKTGLTPNQYRRARRA